MANRNFKGLGGVPYTDDKSLGYACAAAAQTAKKLSMAVSGAKLSHISEARNELARGINSSGNALIQLAIFDRSHDGQRRAERAYREHLLIGALMMAHPAFVIERHLVDEPDNFSSLAHLNIDGETTQRHIEIYRNMLSVDIVEDPSDAAVRHTLENGAIPGIVNFQMYVADTPAIASEA